MGRVVRLFPFSAAHLRNFFLSQPGLISPALSFGVQMHFLAPIKCAAARIAQLHKHTGIEPKPPCCGPDHHQKPRIGLNLANVPCADTHLICSHLNMNFLRVVCHNWDCLEGKCPRLKVPRVFGFRFLALILAFSFLMMFKVDMLVTRVNNCSLQK